MRTSLVAIVSLAAVALPALASPHPHALSGEHRTPYNHNRLAKRLAKYKRCRARFPTGSAGVDAVAPSSSAEAKKPEPSSPPKDDGGDKDNNGGSGGNTGGSGGSGDSGNTGGNGGNTGGGSGGNTGGGGSSNNGAGVLSVNSNCGDIGATSDVRQDRGPNGSIYWINCGIDDGGWRPQYVSLNDVKFRDLWDAVNNSGGLFEPCRPYIDKFYQYAGKYGIPPILLASIAMQESTCNRGAVGGGGEQGLLQISRDKCGGRSDWDCQDPDYNLDTGARYFMDTLNGNGGSLFKTMGMWNGWFEGMTHDNAVAAQWSGCCRCQKNLDYLHQVFNGWIQGHNPYGHQLGIYFNLDVCN